jgi:hypothetical protein
MKSRRDSILREQMGDGSSPGIGSDDAQALVLNDLELGNLNYMWYSRQGRHM